MPQNKTQIPSVEKEECVDAFHFTQGMAGAGITCILKEKMPKCAWAAHVLFLFSYLVIPIMYKLPRTV